MLDKTKNRIDRFKTRNKQYSDEGKRQAKELLRRREDEHKGKHHSSADEYADFWKERGKRFKHQSLGKQISILVIVIVVLVIILWGWLG